MPLHTLPRYNRRTYLGVIVCRPTVFLGNLGRSLTLCRRHIRKVHSVDICTHCLKKITVHRGLGCHKICASPACPNKTGEYHISTYGCVDQRNDDVTDIKYGLVCEELGLPKKCRWSSIMMNVWLSNWLQLSSLTWNQAVMAVRQEMR
jgi:hypothetical protein